jgi:hypothetical protein
MWTRLGLLFALCVISASAQVPELKFRFGFEGSSAPACLSDTNNGGIALNLRIQQHADDPAGQLASFGRGVGGELLNDRALDLPCPLGPGTNGPVAAVTNANLGFGNVKAFTATMWFKARTHPRGSIGPRLFLLGAADSTDDTGATNSIGIKFQTASRLHVQLGGVTTDANFVWSLPTNTWLFVAMVYDGKRLVCYEGNQVAPVTLVTDKAAVDQTIAFGTNGALFVGNRRDLARAFDGLIDDVRFYSGAADPAFVENIRRSALGMPATPLAASASGKEAVTIGGDWVVVIPQGFSDTLKPLVDHRRADGFQVTVVEITNGTTGPQLLDRLKHTFGAATPSRYLLLAGLGSAQEAADAGTPLVPTLPGMVASMNGKPTDFAYSLPDSMGRPTVAVGRFPARHRAELANMIDKTLKLERAASNGLWRSSLLLVQGNPGGGAMAEVFVDSLTRPRLERLHPAWQLSAMSDNPSSIFYLPSAWLHPRSLEAMSAGRLFTVYLGHSWPDGMTSFSTNFLSARDWATANLGPGQGVFFSCGCFGLQADRGSRQSYGLVAMRNPNGPVAVIGATEESAAAPGLLAADGLLRSCAQMPFPTRLADYWLAVQHGLAEGEIDPGTFNLLDLSDGTGGKVPLPVQRTEHLEMWTLLGDPALRLPLVPLTITLKASHPITPGAPLTVDGTLPPELAGAIVRISLERATGMRPPDWRQLPPRGSGTAEERISIAAENNEKINARLITSATAKADGDQFRCILDVPANQSSPVVVVRASADNGQKIAQGVLKTPRTQWITSSF